MLHAYTLEGLFEFSPERMKERVKLGETKKGLPVVRVGNRKRVFETKREAFLFLSAFISGWCDRDEWY